MDYVVAGRRDKNGNKENAEPANRVQSFIKNKPAAQFPQKINQQTDVNSKQPNGKVTTDGKKIVKKNSKPPLSVVAFKPTAGMYKGKIVESKIACIWKLSSTAEKAQAASSMQKHESSKSTNLEKKMGLKSVLDRPAHVPTSVATSRPWIGSLGSSTRTVSAILTTNGNHYVGSNIPEESKLKVPEADKMLSKPRSSIYAQNKSTMETEERRVKVAEWQASKGKTLKRPAMKIAQAKVFETKQVKSHSEPDTQCNQKDKSLEAEVLPTGHFLMPDNQSYVESRQDNLVVKHSASVEVTAASPISEDESAQVKNVSSNAEIEDGKQEDERQELLKYEKKEDVGNKLQVTQVKSKKQSLAVMDKETESKVERAMEPMPQRENTSVVKYSVTTTPYLQSVKKTLDDARTSAHKKTGSIKDLKFLTPVRRSCRIQRRSSHLPAMLQDHDPCVNSLAELVTLDDSPNAFIYRKNPALTEYINPAKTEIC